MCIGDWRFGRLIRSDLTAFSLGVGETLAIPGDPNRVGVTIGLSLQAVAGAGSIAIDGVEFYSGSSFESDQLHFDLLRHGDLPTRSFLFTRTSAVFVGAFIAHIAPADYLAKGLEEFETQYGKFLAGRR